jgi:Pyruvate/2-oxoacid:ferredoxin oxidoreductase delta subunit
MAWKKNANYYRLGLQFAIVILLAYMVARLFADPGYLADFEAYCPLGGMQAFSSFLITQTLACTMNESQIFMGFALLAGVLLFAKLFCSYICPIGTFTEWLGKIGQKLKMYYTITGVADRGLRIFKYILLFLTFFFTIKSSELFCKEYDPYYALFSGFDSDVTLWYAIPAIVITILGAVFVRQFWCKYLCPLSAATNIFANGIMFGAVLGIYLILLAFGLEISWIWPLAIITALGFVLETVRMQGWLLPPLKITRNDLNCTACKNCDLACPMGLSVSDQNSVRHIDCHLCGDCLYACPEKDVLQINRRRLNWLPAAATVGLALAGLLLATTVELPTINLRWGEADQLSKAAVFEMSGLKNIKCFGSSSSFASQMKRVPGVLGVETFVKTHGVKIFYDPERLDADRIRKAIFSPSKSLLRQPGENLDSLGAVRFAIDKLFDSYDAFYLTQLLLQAENIYGFTTSFGEPVQADIYFDIRKLTPQQIKDIIEKPKVTYQQQGREITTPLRFKVASMEDKTARIARFDFIKKLFQPFNLTFNDYEKYPADQLAVYEIAMPQALEPGIRRNLNLLCSHVSTDSFVVRLETVYEAQSCARIYYVKDKTTPESIYQSLIQNMMNVHYSNGKTGLVKNPFTFNETGRVLQ